MDLDNLKELISNAGYEPIPYSSRWMNADACLAFTSNDTTLETIACLTEAWDSDTMSLADFLRELQVDTMGVGTTFFLPEVEWCE